MGSAQIKHDMFYRLNDIPLCESERELGNAYIEEGEHIADLSCRALANIRSGFVHAEHGAVDLARSVKEMFAGHAKH